MRSGSQSPADATAKRDKYIASEMGAAKEAAGQRDWSSALDHLGNAMHTTMDETSPAHVDKNGDPKVWNLRHPFQHHAAESGSVQPTVSDYAKMDRTLGAMYRSIIGNRSCPE